MLGPVNPVTGQCGFFVDARRFVSPVGCPSLHVDSPLCACAQPRTRALDEKSLPPGVRCVGARATTFAITTFAVAVVSKELVFRHFWGRHAGSAGSRTRFSHAVSSGSCPLPGYVADTSAGRFGVSGVGSAGQLSCAGDAVLRGDGVGTTAGSAGSVGSTGIDVSVGDGATEAGDGDCIGSIGPAMTSKSVGVGTGVTSTGVGDGVGVGVGVGTGVTSTGVGVGVGVGDGVGVGVGDDAGGSVDDDVGGWVGSAAGGWAGCAVGDDALSVPAEDDALGGTVG